MYRVLRVLGLIVFVCLPVTALQAATLAFDWTTGLAGLGPTCAFGNSSECATLGYYTKTLSGVTATVSANTTGQASDKVNYRQSSMGSIIGLGVYCTSGCFFDSGEMGSDLIKGQGREVLKFVFDQTVTLTQIKFYGVTAGTARLTYGATTVDIAVAGGGNQTYTLATPASLSSFTIAARGATAAFRITGTTVTTAGPSNLTLSSSATSSVCSGLDVTLTAVDSGGATVTTYTGTVTLSTSTGHGTWSVKTGSGTLTPGSDTGGATYAFVAGDSGDAVLTLTDTHPESLTITAADASNSLSNTSGSLTFSATSPCKLVITASTSATTCAALPVTVAAATASGTLLPYYTGTVSLSTSASHGNWAKTTASGSLTGGSSDNGAASYGFVAGDAGDALFALTNTHADDLTITASDGTLSATSSTISFRDNAFVITSLDALGSDVVAGRNHSFKAELYTRSGSGGSNCSVNASYTGSKNLKAWITRDVLDPGGTAPSIGAVSMPNSVPGSNNLTGVTFSSGVYNFSLATSDVGKYVMNFRDDSGAFTTSVINGTSSTYVVRPFGFAINTGASSTATTASGTAFKKAGASFSTTITAVQYAAADDANSDGVPDSGADLTNNAATASFNTSTSLTHTLALPAGGATGTLSGGGALTGFGSGAKSVSLSYSEVGIINLSALSSSYLGGSYNVTGSLLNVGRFYPDHFALSSATVTPFCSAGSTAFTYMGQAFNNTFTLTAQNSSNATTANYVGSFAKLDTTLNSAMNYKAADTTASPATSLTSRLTMNSSSGSWIGGVANVSASLTLAKNTAGTNGGTLNDGPYVNFKPSIAPVDADGVVLSSYNLDTDVIAGNDAATIGSTVLRYGRLALDNVVGSELNALTVPVRAEYYAGSSNGFVTNTDDVNASCTGTALATGYFVQSGWSGNLGSGETTGTYAIGSTAGSYTLTLSAPGSGNDGAVNITASGVPSWLKFDWDTTTAGDEYPVAKAVFGKYGGSAPVIYRREGFRNN